MILPPIIGLVGRSRSGKDTVAAIVQSMYATPNYRIARLSAPIKDAARALFLFSDAQLEGPEKESIDPRWNITPRSVFQRITDYTMQHLGCDYFTRVLYEKFDQGLLGTHIIVPDVRYEHDIVEIHRRGGLVIKVERPASQLPNLYDCENHLDTIRHLPTLTNATTVEDLRAQTEALIKTHGMPNGVPSGGNGGRDGGLLP